MRRKNLQTHHLIQKTGQTNAYSPPQHYPFLGPRNEKDPQDQHQASVLPGNPLAQKQSSNLRSIFQAEYVGKKILVPLPWDTDMIKSRVSTSHLAKGKEHKVVFLPMTGSQPLAA